MEDRQPDVKKSQRGAAVGATACLISLQHATLPLVFDGRFILWRAGMFLPFAVLLALALRWRPRLLLYLAMVHGLFDLQAVFMVLYQPLKPLGKLSD